MLALRTLPFVSDAVLVNAWLESDCELVCLYFVRDMRDNSARARFA